MTDRLPMPGAMPAELAETLSDPVEPQDRLTERMAAQERKERGERALKSVYWWQQQLRDENGPAADRSPVFFARCMAVRERAMNGDVLAIGHILGELSVMRDRVIEDAEKEDA